ncbi:hypothetical protein BDW62DRAFT_204075 [Aspergillus aurantiobrunneus]
MDQVVTAVRRLQSINILDGKVQELLRSRRQSASAPHKSVILLGSPRTGYSFTGMGLVRALVEAQNTFHSTTKIRISETEDGGLDFSSQFADIHPVSISQDAFLSLQKSLVLCHNDLEPRNILVRADGEHTRGQPTVYKAVAIIDWELAGFHPFAYEFFYKDLVLGSSNLYFQWYRAFKDMTAVLFPDPLPDAQRSLMEV